MVNSVSDKTEQSKADTIDNLRMMGDRVLIVPSGQDGERTTRKGLVIPATAGTERMLRWGEVISSGPIARNVSTGDRVLYAIESGFEVEISGEQYLILRERDIQGVYDSPDLPKPGMYL